MTDEIEEITDITLRFKANNIPTEIILTPKERAALIAAYGEKIERMKVAAESQDNYDNLVEACKELLADSKIFKTIPQSRLDRIRGIITKGEK